MLCTLTHGIPIETSKKFEWYVFNVYVNITCLKLLLCTLVPLLRRNSALIKEKRSLLVDVEKFTGSHSDSHLLLKRQWEFFEIPYE